LKTGLNGSTVNSADLGIVSGEDLTHQGREGHTVDIQSLADFQVSLERACSVLAQKSGHSPKEGIQDEP
jgi:hypothetical protein